MFVVPQREKIVEKKDFLSDASGVIGGEWKKGNDDAATLLLSFRNVVLRVEVVDLEMERSDCVGERIFDATLAQRKFRNTCSIRRLRPNYISECPTVLRYAKTDGSPMHRIVPALVSK